MIARLLSALLLSHSSGAGFDRLPLVSLGLSAHPHLSTSHPHSHLDDAMADAAAAAAEAARRLRAHQLSLEKHFAAPVELLKADEHADYTRWHDAVMYRVQQFPGAAAVLNDVATITPTPPAPAMGEAPNLTPAQFIQLQLRTFILKSLAPQSPAAKLIRDLPHASGLVEAGGVAQSWQVLQSRYYVASAELSRAEIRENMAKLPWPKNVSSMGYKERVSKIRGAAESLDAFPIDDAPASQKLRADCWLLLSKPPDNAAHWHEVIALAKASTNNALSAAKGVGTYAQYQEFVRQVEAAADEVRPPPRALMAAIELEMMGECDDDDPPAKAAFPFAFAAARAASGHSTCMDECCSALAASKTGARFHGRQHHACKWRSPCAWRVARSDAPLVRGMTGGSTPHACSRCPGETMHDDGQTCGREVVCGCCNSTSHHEDHCWVKHGLKAHNMRMRPETVSAYKRWHEQYLAGTYVPLPAGPPRLRRTAPGQRSAQSAAIDGGEFGWTAAEWNMVVLHETSHAPPARSAPAPAGAGSTGGLVNVALPPSTPSAPSVGASAVTLQQYACKGASQGEKLSRPSTGNVNGGGLARAAAAARVGMTTGGGRVGDGLVVVAWCAFTVVTCAVVHAVWRDGAPTEAATALVATTASVVAVASAARAGISMVLPVAIFVAVASWAVQLRDAIVDLARTLLPVILASGAAMLLVTTAAFAGEVARAAPAGRRLPGALALATPPLAGSLRPGVPFVRDEFHLGGLGEYYPRRADSNPPDHARDFMRPDKPQAHATWKGAVERQAARFADAWGDAPGAVDPRAFDEFAVNDASFGPPTFQAHVYTAADEFVPGVDPGHGCISWAQPWDPWRFSRDVNLGTPVAQAAGWVTTHGLQRIQSRAFVHMLDSNLAVQHNVVHDDWRPQFLADGAPGLRDFQAGYANMLVRRFVHPRTVFPEVSAHSYGANGLYYHPRVVAIMEERTEHFVDPSLYMPVKACLLLRNVARRWTEEGTPDRVFAREDFMPIDFVTRRSMLEAGVRMVRPEHATEDSEPLWYTNADYHPFEDLARVFPGVVGDGQAGDMHLPPVESYRDGDEHADGGYFAHGIDEYGRMHTTPLTHASTMDDLAALFLDFHMPGYFIEVSVPYTRVRPPTAVWSDHRMAPSDWPVDDYVVHGGPDVIARVHAGVLTWAAYGPTLLYHPHVMAQLLQRTAVPPFGANVMYLTWSYVPDDTHPVHAEFEALGDAVSTRDPSIPQELLRSIFEAMLHMRTRMPAGPLCTALHTKYCDYGDGQPQPPARYVWSLRAARHDHDVSAWSTPAAYIVGNGQQSGNAHQLPTLDSGAEEIFLLDPSCIQPDPNAPPVWVRVADDHRLEVTRVGPTVITFADAGVSVYCPRAMAVPSFANDLVAASVLAELGIDTYLTDPSRGQSCLVLGDALTVPVHGPPYAINVSFACPGEPAPQAAVAQLEGKWLQAHCELGHCGHDVMQQLYEHTLGTGVTSGTVPKFFCPVCDMAKMRHRHFAPVRWPTVTRAGQMTWSDMHGPLADDVFFRARYAVVYIDEYTRLRLVVIIRDMTSASQMAAFKRYRAWFKYWTGCDVCGFTSDRGGAYVSNDNRDFCDDEAILLLTSVAYNHQGNALPEAIWSGSFPRVRAMLLDMFGDTTDRERFVMRFWALALVYQVNFLGNRLPCAHHNGVAPLTFATGEKHTLRWAHTFGTGANAIIPSEVRGNKTTQFMQPVSRRCVWCGVAETQKGHVMYMLDNGVVEYVAEAKFTGDAPLHRAHPSTPLPPPPLPAPEPSFEPFTAPSPPLLVEEQDMIDMAPIGHDWGDNATQRMQRAGVYDTPERHGNNSGAQPQPRTRALTFTEGDGDAHTEEPPADVTAPLPQPPQPRPRRPDAPWNLAGSSTPAPRRPGSRVQAQQRVNASLAGSLLVMAAAGVVESGAPTPYANLDLAAMQVERDDMVICADIGGDIVPTTSAFGPLCRVLGSSRVEGGTSAFLARGRREQKVRFVAEANGMVRKLVPRDHIEAQRSPDWPHYWAAMLREMDSQTECRTFQYIERNHPSLEGVTLIPLGWVYDCKVDTLTNTLLKYKARLIARGNHAHEFEHYFDRYAGVVRMSTVRLLLALAAQHSWHLTSGDIPTAYLQSWIHDVALYCELPPMFGQPGDMVARVMRSLYGLPQSAYEWGDELRLAMLSFGFTRCHADRQLYLWVVHGRGIVAVCLWVDDVIIAASSVEMRAEYVAFMVAKFSFTDLGPLTRALGCDVHQDIPRGVVTFALTGYIRDAARRLEIIERAYDVPATAAAVRACEAASPPSEGPERDRLAAAYQVLVGVLAFISSTARPDTAWVTHYLSRRLQLPTHQHHSLAVRVMQYLVSTADLAITYTRSDSFFAGGVFQPGDDSSTSAAPHLVADSNLAPPRSTSGWVFVVARAAVVWKVVSQLDPALSSGEAEFYALVTAIATAVHLRQLMSEMLHEWVGPMQVFSDSRVARLMVQNGKAETGVRHVDLKWWFANHHVEQGHVHVGAVNGTSNPANGLTKATSGAPFLAERSYLMGHDLPGVSSARPTSVAALIASFRRIDSGVDVSAAFLTGELSD